MKKKIIIATSIFLGLFVVYACIWGIVQSSLFDKYTNVLEPLEGLSGRYVKEYDDYDVFVKKNSFPLLGGNISISDENSNTLIIWLEINKEDTFGLRLKDENDNGFEIYVDENMTPIQTDNELLDQAQRNVIKYNKEIIDGLTKIAYDTYEFGF